MNINFILVEPKVPENIGASARAIKTMGFSSLILVNPCHYHEGRAQWMAHGSADVLENAKIFKTLEDALVNSDLTVATSTRRRAVKQDNINIRNLNEFVQAKNIIDGTVSIVFGSEESGLSNKDMKLCDIASYIPMSVKHPSLNLAQAVMVYAFELSAPGSADPGHEEESGEKNSASFLSVKQKVEYILEYTGISENPNLAGRIMERIGLAGDKDLNLMHSVAGAIIKKIKK
ncbi:MAG: tRNA/rRNA methyltransferase [Marinilabiliaceae bacterium]|jgi:tRNA/rRNA methyltransferase|nr:tRNA/rRNA methyltransferase [Marinilabiliaceae bacterium]